jgi:hypothetical protein
MNQSQLDRIEKKVDALAQMLMVLMEALSDEDEGGEDGERDQTQPL